MATDVEIIFIGIDLVILMPIASIMWLLLGTHVYYVCTNQTTIEASEHKDKSLIMDTRLKSDENIYDLGLWRNVMSVFGHAWKYWLIPPQRQPRGNGHEFETRPGGRDLLGEVIVDEKML